MKDSCMTFYDPNASLKKAFGPDRPVDQQRKTVKKIKKPVEFEQINIEFFMSLRASIEEVQILYETDKQYCICRQGGECQISDWNILRCMADECYSEFYLLHLKQQEYQKLMVQCDSCDEWYHQECVGAKTNQMKQNEKYVCRGTILINY